jgi:hypothetical protein
MKNERDGIDICKAYQNYGRLLRKLACLPVNRDGDAEKRS